VGGVLHDTFCFAGASCKENIQDGGERGTNDFCSGVHCPLEGLAVCCTTVPVPDSDAAGQHALNGTPVEGGEDGLYEVIKCIKYCIFFTVQIKYIFILIKVIKVIKSRAVRFSLFFCLINMNDRQQEY